MRILVSPLDWGLGHATRCIPIIRALRGAGHEVVIAAAGSGRSLLHGEFPDLRVVELSSYVMRYSRSRIVLPFRLFAQLPFFFASIFRERRLAERLIRDYGIDLVISDSRYGVRSRNVPSVFVTHQLQILPPGPDRLRFPLTKLLLFLNRMALRGFSEIWIPDFPGVVNLSGKLGHLERAWPNVHYIYPLCRFRTETLAWDKPLEMQGEDLRIDVLALLSGPEPQRTLFEDLLLKALQKMTGTRVLVRGLPGQPAGATQGLPLPIIVPGDLSVFDHLSGERLTRFLAAADHVVCRSGYTSVMELAGLGKRNVLFIPTPGQPEQEYLAEHLRVLGLAESQAQENLDLDKGFREAGKLSGFAALFHTESSRTTTWNLAGWIREHPMSR